LKLEYRETNEFTKDFKKLAKRFPSLTEDFETAKKNAVELFHLLKIDNQSVFQINDLKTAEVEFYKLKKFACKSLKGKGVHSGIRLIYAYSTNTHIVDLIEIYYKGDKENEDRERIKKYLKRPVP
jgi:mRNA-degrading endonuclease RelE of RelBE toxin-antitoxin system